ncbi:MAG: MATE family efflux transporter, partial [bacterium]
VETSIFKDAVSYLRISFLGTIFLFGFFAFQSLMRGVGDVKTPLYIVACTVILNLFLDPLFIFGFKFIPAMGVAGAALATIITQALSAFVGIAILLSGKYGIRLKKENLVVDFKLMKKIFRLGFPASIEQSARSIGMLALIFIATGFGTTVIASLGIGIRVLGLVVIPSLGLSIANSTLVGQNLGAGKIKRAEKTSKTVVKMGFVFLTFLGLLFFIFSKQIAQIFIPSDPAVIEMTASFLRIVSLSFGFIAVQQILSGAFRGSGNTFVSMTLTILFFWVLRAPLAYLLSNFTSLSYTGIWWAFPIANVSAALITLTWFAKGSWKNKKLTKEFKLIEESL